MKKDWDYEVHMSHCNQGEFEGSCKYGDHDNCPALKIKNKKVKKIDYVLIDMKAKLYNKNEGDCLKQIYEWVKTGYMNKNQFEKLVLLRMDEYGDKIFMIGDKVVLIRVDDMKPLHCTIERVTQTQAICDKEGIRFSREYMKYRGSKIIEVKVSSKKINVKDYIVTM